VVIHNVLLQAAMARTMGSDFDLAIGQPLVSFNPTSSKSKPYKLFEKEKKEIMAGAEATNSYLCSAAFPNSFITCAA
jgi:hypothetical protein